MPKRYYKYNKNGSAIFLKNDEEDEIYACDEETGEEIYPRRGHPFARNRYGEEYYAKNFKGDEKFPIRKRKSIPIVREGVPVIPRQNSGKQIYPATSRGDQYYFIDPNNDNEPFLLRDENGYVFFAENRSGVKLIPHQYFLKQFEQKEATKYFLTVDAARNAVYSENVKAISPNNICECICTVIVTIPYTVCEKIPCLAPLCCFMDE